MLTLSLMASSASPTEVATVYKLPSRRFEATSSTLATTDISDTHTQLPIYIESRLCIGSVGLQAQQRHAQDACQMPWEVLYLATSSHSMVWPSTCEVTVDEQDCTWRAEACRDMWHGQEREVRGKSKQRHVWSARPVHNTTPAEAEMKAWMAKCR